MPHEQGDVEFYKAKFQGYKTLRSNFEDIWVDIDRFVFGFTGSYNSNPIKGQFTYENVYDTTAVNANVDATNAIVGILWQSGGRSIRISRADNIKDSKENVKWFEDSSKKFVRVLDDPNAKLVTSLMEYTADALGRGSSAVGTYRGTKAPLLFKNHPVRYVYFQDNDEGVTDSVAIRNWLPSYVVVEKYGIENVAPKVVQDVSSQTQRANEVEIITFIDPNTGDDRQERPFNAVHVDMDNLHIMRRGFYEEMPVKVGRIFKNAFETYGRCPALNSLADIKRINAISGDLFDAVERTQQPPLGILGDSVLGQGVIDLSAGAVNMLNTNATDGSPIVPIQTVGDMQTSVLLRQELKLAIKEAYQLDKLIPLQENQSDTATEALLIDRIRNTSIGGMLSRQINEVYTPLMETSFNTLFNDGFFGFIEGSDLLNKERIKRGIENSEKVKTGREPDLEELPLIPKDIAEAFLNGEDVYVIEYLTPAARMLQSEEAQNMVTSFNETMQYAQADPNVLDEIDLDKATRRTYELRGLRDILRPSEDVEKIRIEKAKLQQEQAEQAQQAQEVATAKEASEIQGE